MLKTYNIFSSLFLRSEIMKSASVLISGAVMAQLISILLQPVLRRLFTPETFGIYSVYLSLVGIIVIVSSFRYDDAIVLPRSDKESINLVGLSILFSIFVNLAILMLVLVFGSRLISFLNLPESFPAPLLIFIPAGAFLFSINGLLNAWLVRKKKFVSISVNKLVRRSAEGISQLGLAIIKKTSGLIYGDLAGQVANAGTVAVQASRNNFSLKQVSAVKLKYVLRKYSEFPKYSLIPALMSTSSFLLPPIFINKFYSAELAGYFDLARLVLSIPMAFIASSLSSVLLQRISEKFNRKESFLHDIKPVAALVTLIAAVEIIIIIFFGEEIFGFAFGKQWAISGSISAILVWSFSFNIIITSFSNIFTSTRNIRIYGFWQAFYFTAIMSLVLFRDLPFNVFLKIYVLIEVFCYIVMVLALLLIIYRYESAIKQSHEL